MQTTPNTEFKADAKVGPWLNDDFKPDTLAIHNDDFKASKVGPWLNATLKPDTLAIHNDEFKASKVNPNST
jgi:hypothetical protein